MSAYELPPLNPLAFRSRVSKALVVGCLLAAVAAAPRCVRGDETFGRYFQGLRARRLYSLAERYALERIAAEGTTGAERADLTLELSRTFAEHALYATTEEQLELWKRAEAVLGEFFERDPQNPRRALLEVQRALIPAIEGHWFRWQAELIPYDDSLKQQARAALGNAIKLLAAEEQSLAERARKPEPKKADEADGRLRPHEVRAELFTVRYRLGLAWLDQAEIEGPETAAHGEALAEAEKWLTPPANGYPGEEVTWNSQVLLARAARLRGNDVRALQMLQATQQAHPPDDVLDAVVAERGRVLLAQRKFAEAEQQLQQYLKTRRILPGELGLLSMQISMEQWQAAMQNKAAAQAAALQSALEAQMQRLRREVGGYWSYRGELLLEQAHESRELGPELAASIRAARTQFHNGRMAQSVESYARAARSALEAGKPELAFDLAYTRGSVQVESKDYAGAAASFRELVQQFPENPRAADAGLLGAYALGKLYEENPTKTRRLDYTTALEEHRAKFAGQPTAAEAAWMEALFEERRNQTTAALKLYGSIPAGHARHAAAQVAIARCYEKIIERVHATNQPAEAWESEAVTQLQAVLPEDRTGQKLNPQQAEIALRLARILLHRQPPDFAGADRLLGWIFESAPAAEKVDGNHPREAPAAPAESWKGLQAAAVKWRIVSLAGQGQHAEAEALLKQLTETSPADLLAILDGLSQLETDAKSSAQHNLGELQLAAALRLGTMRDRLGPDEQRRLDLCLAQACAATGQNDRAIKVYENLLKGAPRDPELLTSFGTLLLKCGTPQCLEKGLATWRKLEAQQKPGTVAWLETRLQVARCLMELGQHEQCLKLLGVTRLLYPKLGDAALQDKLAALEAECRRRSKP